MYMGRNLFWCINIFLYSILVWFFWVFHRRMMNSHYNISYKLKILYFVIIIKFKHESAFTLVVRIFLIPTATKILEIYRYHFAAKISKNSQNPSHGANFSCRAYKTACVRNACNKRNFALSKVKHWILIWKFLN